ncbi:MAG: TetR family transcriptional regulator C-terminal domain-containing protein [Verrucomicrobiota bacterium]
MPKKAASKSPADWIEAYVDYLLEHGEAPKSVFRFAKDQGMGEKAFYQHFASFDALEGEIWKGMVSDTVATLDADADYPEYPAQQKLAAFYYTFLEVALDNRSFLLLRFPGVMLVGAPGYMCKFRKAFTDYIKPVLDQAKGSKEIPERGRLNDSYPNLVYAQLLFIIDYWLKDESAQFQRTDALIEKSIALGFDLIGAQVIDSAFDLVRFLAGDRKSN